MYIYTHTVNIYVCTLCIFIYTYIVPCLVFTALPHMVFPVPWTLSVDFPAPLLVHVNRVEWLKVSR